MPPPRLTVIGGGVMGLMTAYYAAPAASAVTGRTPGVKIGFYQPPDAALVPSRIGSVEDFVAECMPGLRGAQAVDVAGAGWRGTGYKFAPWAGQVLARLALQQESGYDIRRFAPGRFAGGAAGGPAAEGARP